ncbi:MAG TPA: lipocalin-like domain-containing protein [Bryobacteraceae bacterium]|nr:lipocalin-like domain-containing protein [Bryobacteraceae bacterium]
MAGAANPGLREENRKSSEHFVGSWTLVSFEHVPPSGDVLRPFGDSPTGLILYQPDGHMSAQLSVGSRTRLACDDPLQASPEAAAEAWRTYFGYWGSFAVDVEKRVVVHRVEGSSFSNWIGTEQVRHFRFEEGNRLILETQSVSGHSTAIWQRMSD